MRKTLRIRALSTFFIVATVLFVVLTYSTPAFAQSLTTGAISGTVADQSGGVIPNVTVTATNIERHGPPRTTKTSSVGTYEITLLDPGNYLVRAEVSGFKKAEQGPITVTVSQTSRLNLTLEVGSSTQTVEVSANAQLIQTENPNTTTTVNENALATLPNPGNDLSYVAQVSAGAVMNTTGGYGNAEFNGLPATSANFSIDGMDANDPFLNLNNSGATNLQLGLNSMEEASVNTLSYSVDQGRQGAAQINFVSKSGSNHIHGNLFETWNGAVMNSVDWFVNAQPTGETAHRPRSNVNQFGGSIGGPILHDKLFYFFDIEGIRIVIPTTLSENNPSQAYESYVIDSIPKGGTDPLNGVTYAPPPNPQAATAYYQNVFKLYGSPAGEIPVPVTGCPLGNGTPNGDGCELTRTFGFSNQTHDLFWKARVDHEISAANKVWYSFSWEKGVQATYTDPVNTVFNAYSTQPQNGASVGWTHVFSPALVNDFNPGYYWYSAIFEPTNMKAALAASPFEFAGLGFNDIFGAGNCCWPEGRNVTNWQILDNLTWSRGAHVLKFGGNLRRTLVSDHDPGSGSIPYISAGDPYQYAFDVASYSQVAFPTSQSEPVGIASLDLYAMDTWKVKSKLTFNFGVRATWNSDPLEQHANFSKLTSGSFFSITHDPNTPVSQIISPHTSLLAYKTPLIDWQPRLSVAYAVRPSTVLRVGGGVFSDIFPGSLADHLLTNFPNDNGFATAFNYPIQSNFAIPGSGNGTAGSVNNDALGNLANAQRAMLAGFSSGVLSCAATNAPANCIPAASFTTVPDGEFKYPLFYEWSAGVEQQFATNWMVKVSYVGTHASDMPYDEAPNAYQNACPGCFSPYIYSASGTAPDPRFGSVTQYLYGSSSSYNAFQTTFQKRASHGLTYEFNYTWSHCIDDLSNEGALTGGFNPNTSIDNTVPGQLYALRGNCDYDVRHSLNGSYIYQFPSPIHGNKILGGALNGWQVSGDLFVHSGYPFSVTGPGYGANGNGVFQGGAPGMFLAAPTGQPVYAKWKTGLSTQTPGKAEVQWLNPNAFTTVVDSTTGACAAGEANGLGDTAQTCQYTDNGRNNVVGPGFANTDLFLSKIFKLGEKFNLRFDVQAYNLFNHMNPAQPGTGAGVPGIAGTQIDAFTINHTQLEPTGLLGSGLGGDNSVRMIALSLRMTF
jgi:hypothetical protein